MTSRFLLCITFFLASFNIYAQNFGGGLSLGMNASQVDGDAVAGFNKAGLSLGGFVFYELSNYVGIQPEILYEQLGSVSQGFIFVKTSHISIPVLLRLSIPVEIGSTTQKFQFHAGPVIGVLLTAKNDNLEDLTDVLNQTDFRIVGDVDYRFSRSLSFMVRYGYSLASFIRTNATVPANLLAPGRSGLAHHYVSIAFRYYVSD